MSFTNYAENKVMDVAFGETTWTAPTTHYLSLHTSDPSETGATGEISGSAYVRQSIGFTVTNNTATNTAVVEFPTATASWGTITHIAIWDAASGGNAIAYAALTSSKAIATGDVLRLPAGDLDITLD